MIKFKSGWDMLDGLCATVIGIDDTASKEIVVPSETEDGTKVCYIKSLDGAPQVESITLPESIIHFNIGCFDNLPNLRKVVINSLSQPKHRKSPIEPFDIIRESNPRLFPDSPNLEEIEMPNLSIGKYSYLFKGTKWFEKMSTTPRVDIQGGILTLVAAAVDFSVPDGVKQIGPNAFSLSPKLRHLTIPASIEKMDRNALKGLNVEEIVFTGCSPKKEKSDGVKPYSYWPKYCIWGCPDLRKVTLPDGMLALDNIFCDCPVLTDVNIPSSVEYIDDFTRCPAISRLDFPESVIDLKIGSNLGITDLNLPSHLKTLAGFEYCANLQKVIIPDSVEKIYVGLFKNCKELGDIQMPVRLRVYTGSFAGTLWYKNGLTEDGDGVYVNGCLVTTKPGCTDLVIKEGTEYVSVNSLPVDYSEKKFKTLTIPASVRFFADMSFDQRFDDYYQGPTLRTVTILGKPEQVRTSLTYGRDYGQVLHLPLAKKAKVVLASTDPVLVETNEGTTLEVPAEAIDAYKAAYETAGLPYAAIKPVKAAKKK